VQSGRSLLVSVGLNCNSNKQPIPEVRFFFIRHNNLFARLCRETMPSFLTPNRHGYSVRFSPFQPERIVCATSQYFGLAGNY
jgi:hypothetical protein